MKSSRIDEGTVRANERYRLLLAGRGNRAPAVECGQRQERYSSASMLALSVALGRIAFAVLTGSGW